MRTPLLSTRFHEQSSGSAGELCACKADRSYAHESECHITQGCKPDTDRLTERAAAASQAWIALREQQALLICSGYASQAGKTTAIFDAVLQAVGLQLRSVAGLPAEANLLAAQAVSAGVPISCVIIEDKAQNSIENALNCLPILQSKSVQHVVLVTSDYHMPRCRLLFELVLQHTSIELSWAEVRATWPDHSMLILQFVVASILALGHKHLWNNPC